MAKIQKLGLPSADTLWADYQRELSVHKVAALYGTTGETVRARLRRGGFVLKKHCGDGQDVSWSREDIELLKRWYVSRVDSQDFQLDKLAKKLRRLKSNVSRKARSLGLTSPTRRKSSQAKLPNLEKRFDSNDERNRATGERVRSHIKQHGHPRGMLGLKHSAESLQKMSVSSKKTWDSFSDEKKSEITEKILRTATNNGTLIRERPNTTWKAGWREIGGKRKYYRSRWEANYARYLEWLKSIGEIHEWHHEPKTFWFDGVKRGCRTYLPDFQVIEKNGKEAYHEVKGWMDKKSVTKLKRMARYYPEIPLVVIDGKQYRSLQSQVGRIVPEWEG